jgi:hypothetical protein
MLEFERLLSILGWSLFGFALLLDLALLYRSGQLVVAGFFRHRHDPRVDFAAWGGLIGGLAIAVVFGVVIHFQRVAQTERRAEVLTYAGLSAKVDERLQQLGNGRVAFRVLVDIRDDAALACESTSAGRSSEPRIKSACALVKERRN